jgi:hypothetical protein
MPLSLSRRHQEAFQEEARRDFHRRLLAYLRRELPDETAAMDDAALIQRIELCEEKASSHRIVSEAGITQFTCLSFMGGPDFDGSPEVREYLRDDGLDPEEKLNELVDYMRANPPASQGSGRA